ncbi:hypothetical protein GQ55_2G190800 [Panicum hallii var. hallii]|uniref:Uncharacterized protein n=1 Tax=Panicum hallii var. hallii TaxID=1504633 RepID=A0A2T7EQD5_9POAL|nr:hypothetical protein GQ55_2G190800 [Panicum hallii var. hallii]
MLRSKSPKWNPSPSSLSLSCPCPRIQERRPELLPACARIAQPWRMRVRGARPPAHFSVTSVSLPSCYLPGLKQKG